MLCGTELDLYIPSFPLLQEAFSLSPFEVELSLTINFVCFAVFCLIAGALGDHFNRRVVILWSLAGFIFGSAICAFSPSYPLLLLGRAIQGIGIAGPATLAYVIVADENPMDKQVEIMGVLNGVVTLTMAGAPIVGSFITLYSGWQGNFTFLMIFGVICFIASYIFIPNRHKASEVNSNFSAYKPLLQSKTYVMLLLTLILLILPYWMFISLAPILYMQDLDVPLRLFGFYQGSLIFFFALISIASPWFLRKFSHKQCFYAGVLLTLLSLIFISFMAFGQVMSPILITLGMIFYSLGVVFPVNILFPMSLDIIPDNKGCASAVLQSARLMGSALMIQFVSHYYTGSFQIIGLAIVICAMLSMVLILISSLMKLYQFVSS
tara:strand:- start:6109 stop:7245 length:1137 start_codon:yes stop_codon:yes gene_type:complete